MKSFSIFYKFLRNPLVAVLVFLVLQEALSGFLIHQASNLTGVIVTIHHFHKLPILERKIRGQFIYSLVVLFCVFVMSWVTPHIKLKSIGLTGRLSLIYLIAGFVAQVGIDVVLAFLVDRNGQILASVYVHPKVLTFQVFVWCLLIGISEETTSRGYVLQILEKQWGSAVALVLSSILFGLLHFQNQGETATEVIAIILSGGLPYAAAYLMTRSLWLPIGLHCGSDFVMILLYGDTGVPPAVPRTDALADLVSFDISLQIVLAVIFVLVAMRTGRWIGKNPLAPANPLAASTPTSSAE